MRLVGSARAKETAYTRKTLNAEEAERVGLVDRVVLERIDEGNNGIHQTNYQRATAVIYFGKN